MKGNEEEWSDEEDRLIESSSFRISELLIAIESLSQGWLNSYNEQNRVEKVTKAQRLQLPKVEISTTNDNQHIKTAKLPEHNIKSGLSKRTTFSACPQRSIFKCNMDAKPLKCNIDTKLQVNQKSKLVCNWPKKPILDIQFDREISPLRKRNVSLHSNVFGGEYNLPSQSIPFPPEQNSKKRTGADKPNQVRRPCPNIKPFLFQPQIQQSVLAGAVRYEPFIGLKDLQWKLYKGAVKKRAPEVLMDEHKCILQPILTQRQHKGNLPVPLICKGNKYIEVF
ncbi:iron-sulfur cluster assembly 1 homolog, mitochondrial isoform X1 [Heterodontus francisci]|uniref:iron-sulfur cluster assembly 1 homolog, mitochondrial isoform X1 n=1 Tax=Heterodontus francisci TaxID=7792 RepID=UPI00355C2EE0